MTNMWPGRYALPSQEVCAQLDIAAENLDRALADIAESIGALNYPRGASFVAMAESAAALHNESEGLNWTSENLTITELQKRVDELRDTCVRAKAYVRAIESSPVRVGDVGLRGGGLVAVCDALADVILAATRAADAFERDWDQRKALARLRGLP